MRHLQNGVKRQIKRERANMIKVKILYQVLKNIQLGQKSKAFGKIVANSIKKKNENDRKRIKQKKEEIHSQIILLTEKDTKIRKQEAYLQMKEQRIVEKEKELKDKTKRLAEISK